MAGGKGLVDYSSSDSDDGREASTALSTLGKRKRLDDHQSDLVAGLTERSQLPPLPPRFHDLYVSASRASTSDDPSLHGGRMRVIPHVDGNWATHIYLEWHPKQAELDDLSSLLDALQDGAGESQGSGIHNLLASDLGAPLPLHISLSRSVILTAEQRKYFTESLQEAVGESKVRPFRICFTTLGWVPNYESTRWFLVLYIERPTNDELNRLLGASNSVVISFGQQPLYVPDAKVIRSPRGNARSFRGGREFYGGTGYPRGPGRVSPGHKVQLDCSPHFHISLGWRLEKPSQEMVTRTSSAPVFTKLETLTAQLVPEFDAVKVRVGNTVAVVPLPTRVKEGTGLIGV